MNGIRIAGEKHLRDIDEVKCCRPQNHPDAYESCYEEDVAFSFDKKGWSECNLTGYYMTGFYKGDCEQLHCIEKFYCCKMKTGKFSTIVFIHERFMQSVNEMLYTGIFIGIYYMAESHIVAHVLIHYIVQL